MIEMIALIVDNSVMSVDNQMPIILETHLDRLRDTIKDKVIVLGKDCYESLGAKNALGSTASRIVILSRTMNKKQGITVVNSLTELISEYPNFIVIGGESMFYDLIILTDIVHITEVSERAEEGITKTFPALKRFTLENPSAEFQIENDHYFRFLTYKR